MPIANDDIRKINTNNGVTGNCYLTNEDSITVGSNTYNIVNGFDFAEVTEEVQEAAKYKKTGLEVDSSVPNVSLSSNITLMEAYDEAHIYKYSQTPHTGNDGNSHQINLPQRFIGWQYVNNGTPTDLPTTLTQDFIEQHFSDNNLDVYAKWNNNVKFVRVIPYVKTNALYPLTASCEVYIESDSYTGNTALPTNYSKILLRKESQNDSISWAIASGDIGRNTSINELGNGCQMYDSKYDIWAPCLYGANRSTTLKVKLNKQLNGTYNGSTYINAFKPEEYNSYATYKSINKLSAHIDDTSNVQGTYTDTEGYYQITQNISTNNYTFFLPIVLNTHQITIKCEDNDNQNNPSSMGKVGIESLNHNSNYSEYQITADCVNGETVIIIAIEQTGYSFSYWADENNNLISTDPSYEIAINSNVNGKIYVAHYTAGQYTLTYHKETLS